VRDPAVSKAALATAPGAVTKAAPGAVGAPAAPSRSLGHAGRRGTRGHSEPLKRLKPCLKRTTSTFYSASTNSSTSSTAHTSTGTSTRIGSSTSTNTSANISANISTTRWGAEESPQAQGAPGVPGERVAARRGSRRVCLKRSRFLRRGSSTGKGGGEPVQQVPRGTPRGTHRGHPEGHPRVHPGARGQP